MKTPKGLHPWRVKTPSPFMMSRPVKNPWRRMHQRLPGDETAPEERMNQTDSEDEPPSKPAAHESE